MIDNSRLVQEFGMQYRPYRERVLQIINEVRKDQGRSPLQVTWKFRHDRFGDGKRTMDTMRRLMVRDRR